MAAPESSPWLSTRTRRPWNPRASMDADWRKRSREFQTLGQVPAPALTVLWPLLTLSPQSPATVEWVKVSAPKQSHPRRTGWSKEHSSPYQQCLWRRKPLPTLGPGPLGHQGARLHLPWGPARCTSQSIFLLHPAKPLNLRRMSSCLRISSTFFLKNTSESQTVTVVYKNQRAI